MCPRGGRGSGTGSLCALFLPLPAAGTPVAGGGWPVWVQGSGECW